MQNRRKFLQNTGLLGLSGIVGSHSALAAPALGNAAVPLRWPNGARLLVSVSMQFESGGQPPEAESPFPPNMAPGHADLPAATWYAYGYQEGIPRMLDNWDKLGIKVTSHMVGSAVLKNPALAKEIVARGHEAAAHGMNWSSQYAMDYAEEKKFIADGVAAVRAATGVTPKGYNANWLRRGPNTLRILQELGFTYHIDDLGRDEPFLIELNGKDFAVVPYTLRCNDILLIEGRHFSTGQFLEQVKMEFDELYEESARKRRMLSVSFHDRIGGTPQMVRAAREMFRYMQKHSGVAFMRKDEIAAMALADPAIIRA
ncbi:polysaccharide deacetylase family protein [Chitinophaga caseinilytica]|uniref:Polysaccharide deacetylase family protein n=1 Tax=Chitinophaga caseinilytica TaxID=2267521 RepID=A0ABZ2Z782_9BACT